MKIAVDTGTAAVVPAYTVPAVELGVAAVVYVGSEPVPAEGLARAVTWAGAAGATDVVLDPPGRVAGGVPAGVVRITPAPFFEERGTMDVDGIGLMEVVVDDGADVPLRRITLYGLRRAGEEDAPELTGGLGGLRLLASTPQPGGGWMPRCVVPAESPPDPMPRALATAAYTGRVLTLPTPLTGPVRLTLVEGAHLEAFAPVAFDLDRLKRQAEYAPRDLVLTGPDGQTLWSMPGPFSTAMPTAETDVRLPLEQALRTRLQDGAPLEAAVTLTGADKSAVQFAFGTPGGALLRTQPGPARVALAGDPAPLDLGGPLDAAAPATATAGVYVRYDGLRVLEEASDAVPSVLEAGPVVRHAPVTRLLPPSALDGWDVARVGLVGRAPEACELEVTLVARRGPQLGAPMGPPGVVRLEAGADVRTAWVELPPRHTTVGAAAVQVTARTGRFYWAGLDAPLVRVVVRDPAPPPQPLRLDGADWLTVDADGVADDAHALPAAAFTGAAPVLDSPLFLTVDLVDLTLRYPR